MVRCHKIAGLSVEFTQINLHRSYGAALYLVGSLASTHTNIPLIHEPHMRESSCTWLRACTVLWGINATLLPQVTSRDVVADLVDMPGDDGVEIQVVICYAYSPGYVTKDPPPPALEKERAQAHSSM